ncbi:hypothetical protein SteCoe_17399 [Stentor coeruleus]|uniref:Uncharacterized protein n=1 Tax=Stentor coeruleus TaxID=5963 RepID=A0A1R2BZ08_9CILI|nr:hypothetical protein SteCoe_17399 [Stentor coeruleus]
MNFSVRHPQLEFTPGQYPEGLKRYNFNKNQNSCDYPAFVEKPGENLPQSSSLSISNYPSKTFESQKFKSQLQVKQQETDKLKSYNQSNYKSFSPQPVGIKYNNLDHSKSMANSFRPTYNYSIFDIAKHPAFQQPKFTKQDSKVVTANPVSGFNNYESSLGQYGNMVMSSNRTLPN